MKVTTTVVAACVVAICLGGVSAARGQEALSRDEGLKLAFALCRDLPQMLGTPIPTDPDVKRPVGAKGDNRGLLVFPESKLSADAIAKAGAEVAPIGQLYLRGLLPAVNGQAIGADRLLVLNVGGDNNNAAGAGVVLCALGVRKGADGKAELLVYGKDKEPLAQLPLTEAAGGAAKSQENPIEVGVSLDGNGVMLTLNVLGRYTASVPLAME